MGSLRGQSQIDYARDFRIADYAIAHGRVAATSYERESFWTKWCGYVQSFEDVDPYLANEEFGAIVRAVTGFAGRVRQGHYGRGHQVSCARVATAVRAIGQTCEMERGYNPLYRAPEKYLKPIEIMFAGFRRDDPLPVPEIAVPVSVPEQCAAVGLSSAATPKDNAVGDLALISFFYLLRVGEYTRKSKKGNTRTIQFRLCDVAFKNGNSIVDRNAPASAIMAATAATLRLSNQKNGVRGSMVHRCATGGKFCPVMAVARRYLHMRDNNADDNDIISSFWDHLGQGHVTDGDMRVAIRRAVIALRLDKHGFSPSRVGTHSFRAGGAMALKFSGADRDDIKKMGRWSSDTFLIYIHDQIAEYSEGWSKKMAEKRPFFNLEGAYS